MVRKAVPLMSGRPCIRMLWRVAGLLVLISAVGWMGCGTPQERYQVLSFFFDGVPDPDAPKGVVDPRLMATTGPAVMQVKIVSRHKPYVDNQCNSCHRSATGIVTEFTDTYKGCVRCHKTVMTDYPRMHGPVARGLCGWCHTGHESTQLALLKDTPIKVCTQCHDNATLGSKPQQHNDGVSSCLSCHFGHGGKEEFLLKPEGRPEWPGRGAGSQPASQPGSQPAGPGGGESTTQRVNVGYGERGGNGSVSRPARPEAVGLGGKRHDLTLRNAAELMGEGAR